MSANIQSIEIPRICELSESHVAASEIHSASDEARDTCGLAVMELSGAVATVVSQIDVLAFNRVVGFGIDAPATEDDLDAFIEFYRAHKVPRFFMHISPDAQPTELAAMLESRRIRHYNNWAKLYRRAEPAPEVECDLRIEQIGADQGDTFATIVDRTFGFPVLADTWVASLVGKPGWRQYVAFDGDLPAAAAALFVHEGTGWLGFAATDPRYRKRGAQSALITRRINDACELGCQWLTTETAEDTPEKRNPSYHNMLRMGFETAYLRPNYLWKMDGME
jgi:GNAT superfamily N-acetyltransferase